MPLEDYTRLLEQDRINLNYFLYCFTCSLLFDFGVAALVESLSAIVLIVLFLMQKFGTSRVSFLFSPIMGAWTLSTPLVGVYSIVHHYPSIFKAISPHYIFQFFLRNGKEGWLLLGGTVLCITGKLLFWPKFFLIEREVMHVLH